MYPICDIILKSLNHIGGDTSSSRPTATVTSFIALSMLAVGSNLMAHLQFKNMAIMVQIVINIITYLFVISGVAGCDRCLLLFVNIIVVLHIIWNGAIHARNAI